MSATGRRSATDRLVWSRVAATLVVVVYCVFISFYLLRHGGWPTPDYLIPPLLFAAIALGKGPSFLLDWGPFLLLIIGWQASAGIADGLGRPVHVQGPLALELALFGGKLPTVELQRALYRPGAGSWYDWVGVIQHSAHFVLPVAVGFWIWTESRRRYWRFLAGVLTLFFLGFLSYALYPAAPPWMAGLMEESPFVHRIAVETMLSLPASAPVGLAYTHISPNTVAAIPSLHAALPLLIALSILRLKGWLGVPWLLYTAVMGFFLVYLGEHYVVDVLAGYAFAVVAFAIVWLAPWPSPIALPRLPRVRALPPAALRLAGNAVLPALGVLSTMVILFSLRPNRPAMEEGPIVPGLQVQAGSTEVIDPQPCGSGASPSLAAGNLLLPVSERYAAYLFDLDSAPGCYVLTANTLFPPPTASRVAMVARRGPVPLQPLPFLNPNVEWVALFTGAPSPQLIERGFRDDHRFALVVFLGGVADPTIAADVVASLAELTILADPPVEPDAPAPADIPNDMPLGDPPPPPPPDPQPVSTAIPPVTVPTLPPTPAVPTEPPARPTTVAGDPDRPQPATTDASQGPDAMEDR